MRKFWKLAGFGCGVLLTTGCVYPYETAFEACDNEAGGCYNYCEQFADDADDYEACHADCEVGASQCFAAADRQMRLSQASYGYSGYGVSPWYGSYGYWYPNQGYFYGFRHPGGRYNRRYPGYRPYPGRGGRGNRGGRGGNQGSGGNNAMPPPQSPPPQSGQQQPPPQSGQPPPPPPSSSPRPPPPPNAVPPRKRKPQPRTPRNRDEQRHKKDK